MKKTYLHQNLGKKHFEALSFLQKVAYMVDVLGYSESDFEFYNQAYELFARLTDKQKNEALEYSNQAAYVNKKGDVVHYD